MSTNTEALPTAAPAPAGAAVEPFDMDSGWMLHEQVSIRPERFGALLYHFGTRRLSFLKSPTLLTVVQSLQAAPSAREACRSAGVPDNEMPSYRSALRALAASDTIRPRDVA